MTVYNVVSPGSMVAGQPEDISPVLSNFNAIAAVLNGNIDNANINAAAAIAASKLSGYPADGTKALFGDGTWAVPGMPLAIALPGGPVNGQLVALTDSLTVPTYVWPLRYNSTALLWQPYGEGWGYNTSLPAVPATVDRVKVILVDSLLTPTYSWTFQWNKNSTNTDKWDFVGGAPAHTKVEASEAGTGSNTAYTDFPTVGPSFTAIRGGLYTLDWSFNQTHDLGSAAYVTPKIGAAAAADINGCQSGSGGFHTGRQARLTLAAADLVKLQGRVASGTMTAIVNRELRVLPIRVS